MTLDVTIVTYTKMCASTGATSAIIAMGQMEPRNLFNNFVESNPLTLSCAKLRPYTVYVLCMHAHITRKLH